MKGSYSLIIETPEKAEIGALGTKKFNQEYAVYNGSAFGPGGLKRVLRHFSSDKKIHWHIDYLLKHGELKMAAVFPGKDLECELSEKLDGRPVNGFGSSDCSCGSHLLEYRRLEEVFNDFNGFSGVKVLDRERYKEYRKVERDKPVEDLVRDLPGAEAYQRSRDI